MMQNRENGQKPQFGQFFDDFEVKYLQIRNFSEKQVLFKLKVIFCTNFQNPTLSLFYLYSPLTSCKKSEKSLELFLRKLRYQPTNYYQQRRSYRTTRTPVQRTIYVEQQLTTTYQKQFRQSNNLISHIKKQYTQNNLIPHITKTIIYVESYTFQSCLLEKQFCNNKNHRAAHEVLTVRNDHD